MKLLGSNDGVGQPNRSQDDAAVGYVFQRHPHEPEFPHFAHKAPRWASGDDGIIDVSIIYPIYRVPFVIAHYFHFFYCNICLRAPIWHPNE